LKKKEYSTKIRTDSAPQRAKDYSMQQHRTSRNFSTATKMTAFKLSYKDTHQQIPPIRTTQGTWARSDAEKAHAFAKHLAQAFHPHLTENEPEEEKLLPNPWKPPTNSNHQSTAIKEQKSKQQSTN
jgi:hypothetical protein